MDERRKISRRKCNRLMTLVDRNTTKNIGSLVDISVEGILLLSNEPVELNRILQLTLELPEDLNGQKSISFGAESLWSEHVIAMKQYWTGFRIIDISAENIERIESLTIGKL